MDKEKEAVENAARKHIEFIKSRGEKGLSVIKSLAIFEDMEKDDPNVLGTLRIEYPIIETLAGFMKAEIERMEEES